MQDLIDRTRRRTLGTEVLLVLGVSLGASAIWAMLRIVERLTRTEALASQTAALNVSQTPDRPWLDLAYQLAGILLGVVPALLAVHLINRDHDDAWVALGLDRRRPGADLATGAGLAALIGLPGLGLVWAAQELGLNAQIVPAALQPVWWAVPVLVLAAIQNAVLEEVVMIGYLLTRLRQLGWGDWPAIVTSAVIRGGYHLYQGFGGFVGNTVMGVVFGYVYKRYGRVMPLVIAHALLDIVAFVGYALLKDKLAFPR